MTITITATAEPDNVPPRVRIDITATAGAGTETILRYGPDGRAVPVRTLDGNPLPLSGVPGDYDGLIYDYEMPLGQTVVYGRIEDDDSTPPILSDEVFLADTRVWLVHPGVPALSMPIFVASFGGRVRRASRGVFQPMGRSTAVVVSDGARKGFESLIEVKTESLDELANLYSLLEDASTLLLNVPPSLGWGVATTYISVGDVEESRLMEYAGEPRRYVSLPYVVTARPAGGTQSQRTYADLLEYATYADLSVAYEDYLDLLAGP